MYRRVSVTISVLMILSVFGCAAGTGVNRNVYFHSNDQMIYPVKIVVDEKSRSIESGIIMGNSFPMLSATVGLVGAAVASNQGFVNLVRGKFAAGIAFENSSKKINRHNPKDNERTLILNLLQFQQYAVPGHLQAFMKFSSRLDGSNDTYLSAYSCDLKIKGAMFMPGDERDMLSEMVDATLLHWSSQLPRRATKGSLAFPATERGKLTGDGAECTYELFVKT